MDEPTAVAREATPDPILARITDYTERLQFSDLPSDTVHQCKRRVIDTLGCALGAYGAEPSRIAREVALRSRCADGAHILGTHETVLPELAAFANGVMGRYLDGNDTFPGGGGHPSDMLAGILAIAEVAQADGKALIAAITVGYEVYHNLFAATRLREKGMDNVFYTAVGSAAAGAKLLALDRDRIASAVSLAATPNIALEATRRGKLSMWKGSAAGNAARNGVFAAVLAAAGMTGPEKPFVDERGLRGLAGDFQLAPFGGPGVPYRVTHSSMKYFLSEYHSQSPITAALVLSRDVAVEDVESISVHTDRFTWYEIGSEPEKWRPTTRETADHSLPYIVSAVLIDGLFSDAIFAEARWSDPRILRLADKIKVHERREFTQRFPDAIPCEIEALLRSGERKVVTVEYPRGHFRNPMSDDEVNEKFCGLAQRVLPSSQGGEVLDMLWKLETSPQVGSLVEKLSIPGT